MTRRHQAALFAVVAVGLAAAVLYWRLRAPTPAFSILRNLTFAVVDGEPLHLDLYLPTDRQIAPPVIIWLHGGAWKWGDKEHNPLRWTATEGYASVTVNYRLSSQAKFPAAIHDCKAVVRWLRANAGRYGIDARRIAVAGASAGGHLAALLATTSDVPALEGSVGGNLEQSSAVQAVISFAGPMDLTLYQNRAGTDLTTDVTDFLGAAPWMQPEAAKLASPIHHLDSKDPPFLIVHSARDEVVAVEQSERFHRRCMEAGLESTFVQIESAEHDGPLFYDHERKVIIREFLQRHLRF